MEKYGYWRMLSTLLRQERVAETAGVKLSEELTPKQETKDAESYSGA
jgi:hypothetical protein